MGWMRELRPGALVLVLVLTMAPAAILAATAPAAGQVPSLGRVDSLITAGDYDAARENLGLWWSARDRFVVPGSDMARALTLRAQLAPDPTAAEPDYLAVVLGYPASPHAPEALLRLGQGILATGDAARSAAYLGRLVTDYPGRPQRLTGLLWLARANSAARRPGAACTAAREGLRDATDPDLAAMLRVEAATACSASTAADAATPGGLAGGLPGAGAPPARPAGPPAGTTTPAAGAGGARIGDPVDGEWAVQSGAFRYLAGAERLVGKLEEAGYSPRLVRVPRSDLLRVRIGRFTSADSAAALVARLRSQGFDAVAVRDAAQERRP